MGDERSGWQYDVLNTEYISKKRAAALVLNDSTTEAVAAAINHLQTGEILAAEQACAQILGANPRSAPAWQILGLIAFQSGHNEVAAAHFAKAIELEPNFAAAHYNLANALRVQGKLPEAELRYRYALSLQPNFAEVLQNLSLTLHLQGRLDDATGCYRRALSQKPTWADGWNNLGQILNAQSSFTEALVPLQRAIALQPQLAAAYNNLGVSYQGLGRPLEAAVCYRRALELAPNNADAHSNLGSVLHQLGNLDDAIAHYRQAIAAPQTSVPSAGSTFIADLYNNLGNALRDQGLLYEAIPSFRQAITLDPAHVTAYSNLLYTLYFCEGLDTTAILAEHRQFDEQFALPLARHIQPHANDRCPIRRLRIGYVSPDFRFHCQSCFTLPVLAAHDGQQFEIFCYSDIQRPDEMTSRLQSHADQWRDISHLSDHQAAELIRHDQIDILVDLTMHMAHGRPLLFARKPATVQACWLAYPGTTGLSAMDYRLTDPHLDPPGQHDSHYSERSIRLPDAFWCFQPLVHDIPVNPPPALTSSHITFGCLNNFCKINPSVLALWARVLHAVEHSRLLLLAPSGSPRQRTTAFLSQRGIAPERITFIDRQPLADYLRLYHQIDICLDTFPANGHTTSLDSLWMGVPVVTLVGETAISRGGLSQLANLGLSELVAANADQFVQIATELSSDLPRLQQLRSTLRERLQSSPLMNAQRFARNIENAFRRMWRTWCST